MKKRFNKKGFTIAEILVAVAIIIILCAFAFVGVGRYKKDLSQLELDQVAQDIFITAQTHLSSAKSQKYLGKTDFGEEEASETGIYYFVIPADSSSEVYQQILPEGSIDPSIVSQGSFILRYDMNAGRVLDVFYSLTSGSGSYTLSGSDYDVLTASDSIYRSSKESRSNYKNSGYRIGYYGGAEPSSKKKLTIPSPTITIINGDILEVIVTPNNTDANIKIALIVTGAESNKSHEIVLYENKNAVVPASEYRQLLDSIPEMDGVTENAVHFKEMFSDLIPGENLKIKAVASKDGQTAESVTYTVNSLFGSLKNDTFTISSFRHLENLNSEVSGIDAAKLNLKDVVQKTDLDWNSWIDSSKNFIPVVLTQPINYDGENLSIENVRINTNGNAGIFANLTGGKIEDLEIINIKSVTSSGYAGGLVGETNGTDIKGVFVHNTGNDSGLKVLGTTAAGGLAGYVSSGDIEACSASVYVCGSSGPAGGLVGQISGTVNISGSYAGGHTKEGVFTTITSDQTGRINVSANTCGGGLVGFGESTLTVENSYATCSARFASVGAGHSANGLIGNGIGTVSNCYSIGKMYNNANQDITPTSSVKKLTSGKATAVPYDDIVKKLGLGKYEYPTVRQLMGTSYTAAYNVYPFLSVHYGDWLISSGMIKAYRNSADEVANSIKYVTVQTGCEKIFYTNLVAENVFKNKSVTVVGKSGNIAAASADTGLIDGKTQITITAGTNVGVGYVDLESEGSKLRFVVIVHDRKITMTGTRSDGTTAATDIKTASSMTGSGTFDVYGYVKLQPVTNKKSGTLAAEVSSYGAAGNTLTAEAVKTQLSSLLSSSSNMIVSLDNEGAASVYNNWNKVKTGDPSYVEDTRKILDSYTLNGSVLSFTGKSSGTLPVYAHWAVDDDLYARSDIKMGGARAMIKSVKYHGKQVGPDYPYSIDIEPTAGEVVKLDLKPILYNAPAAVRDGGVYKWEVYKGSNTTPIATKETTHPNTGLAEFVLDNDTSVTTGTYRITLTFTYEQGGERQSSVDEVLVNIYRKSSRGETNYGQITIKSIEGGENGHANWDTPSNIIYLEQVESGNGYTGWNKVKLSSRVNGTVNAQTKWSIGYSQNGPWTSIPNTDELTIIAGTDNVQRGTVGWKLDSSSPSGDYIEVIANDLNDYDTKLKFWLKTEAVDAIEGDDDVSSKILEVYIMPKLKIPSSVRTYKAWYGVGQTSLATNRPEAAYQYNWSARYEMDASTGDYNKQRANIASSDNSTSKDVRSGETQTLSGHSSAYSSLTVKHNGDREIVRYIDLGLIDIPIYQPHFASGTSFVNVSYGPYSIDASFSTAGVTQDTEVNINAAGEESSLPYFIVESGKTDTLDFSWGSTYDRYVSKVTRSIGSGTASATSAQNPCNDNVTITLVKNTDENGNEYGTSHSNEDTNVSWQYSVKGNENVDKNTTQPIKITWTLKYEFYFFGWYDTDLVGDVSRSFNFYVYGLNVKNGSRLLSTDSNESISLGGSATWTADYFFPTQLSPSDQTISWSVSNSNVLNITDLGSGQVKLDAKRITSNSNPVYVTCTYTVHCGNNGEDYKCVKTIPVTVTGETFGIKVEPCTADDKATLGTLFFNDSSALSDRNWIGQSSYTRGSYTINRWPLVENYTSYDNQKGQFRADEIYLKVSATGGSPALEKYYININSDTYYVTVDSKLNKAVDADMLYIKVAANENTASTKPIDLSLNIGIGDNHTSVPIDYYKSPMVELSYAPDESAAASNAKNPIAYQTAYASAADIYGAFTASILPTLLVDGEPVDSVDWSLSAPSEEYKVEEYAFLIDRTDDSEFVSLFTMNVGGIEKSIVPDFKVIVNAKSHLASNETTLSKDSYALVFLPEPNDSGTDVPYEPEDPKPEVLGEVTIGGIKVKATKFWSSIVSDAKEASSGTSTIISKGTVFSQGGVVYVAYSDINANTIKNHASTPNEITGIKKLTTGNADQTLINNNLVVYINAGSTVKYSNTIYITVSNLSLEKPGNVIGSKLIKISN